MNDRMELGQVLDILHLDIERTNEQIGVVLETIGAAMAASHERFVVAMRKFGEAFRDPLSVGMAFALLALDGHRVLLDPACTSARRIDEGRSVGVSFRLRAPFRWFAPVRRRLQDRLMREVMSKFPNRFYPAVYVWVDGGPIDDTPRPPYHANCRCTTAPAPTKGANDGEERGE